MLKLERFFPLIFSVAFILGAYLLGIKEFVLPRFDLILSSLITVAVTIIGFALTIVTIFITIVDTDAMMLIRNSDKTKHLIRYLFSPIVYGTLLIIYCLYLFLVVDGATYMLGRVHLYILLFLTIYETLSIIRISMIMARVIDVVAGEKSSSVSIKQAKGEDAFN